MGYGAETTTDEVLEGVDLSGRVAVVTGASTGLGLETARALASAGARVVLGVRGRERGEAALARITERVPHAELELELVDLASLESVRAFTDRVLARHALLHLVVANAGVMYTPFGRTAEGFELQFGTNHVGHFVLVNRLVPALVVGAPSRVVVLSSAGHHGADIDWDDPNFERRPYDKFSAYSQSKTANVLFALELDRRLASRGVHA
ncbi:MAG TPA: SDR family NAD(P)-dependent oxidoreductase, partial [Acidimicrobiales bacterium]